jgi:V/A-type H+-transporting ATPase subunit E
MSEKTLDKLIATLKLEAVEAAEKEANGIVENAQQQALKIIREAEDKSNELLKNAQKEAHATRDKGEAALKQAARDLTVSVRNDLLKLLKVVLEQEVENNFTPDLTEKAILKVLENVGSGAALKLPENMETKLANKIQKRLQETHDLDSIIKDAGLPKGFAVTKTDQGWSYHISPVSVAELLNAHLSQKWVNMLKNQSNS